MSVPVSSTLRSTLLWAVVPAAIALFAASTRQIQGSVLNRQFAFCGGGFSLWLCLDDM